MIQNTGVGFDEKFTDCRDRMFLHAALCDLDRGPLNPEVLIISLESRTVCDGLVTRPG